MATAPGRDPAAALAEAVREACIRAAAAAYEDAGIRGLCEEGRWEAAVGAMRSLELRSIAREYGLVGDGPASPSSRAGP